MIHHHGASLSKQQTTNLLLSSHGTQQDASLSTVQATHTCTSPHQCQPFLQPGQLTWLHIDGLSFTLKSWTKLLAFMSAVYAWPATWNSTREATQSTTACEWPAVFGRSTNQCHACFDQLQSSSLRVPILHSDSSPPLASHGSRRSS